MKIQPHVLLPNLPDPADASIAAEESAVSHGTGASNAANTGQAARHRVLSAWQAQAAEDHQPLTMAQVVDHLLTTPSTDESPRIMPDIWPAVHNFDTGRQRGEPADALDTPALARLAQAAAMPEHPRHADASLLHHLLIRPIDADAKPLKPYLAALVGQQLRNVIGEKFDTAPQCAFSSREGVLTFVRTVNGILQGASLASQDYTCAGRTLMLEGARQLADALANQDTDPQRLAALKDANSPLAQRLQQALFCFPTVTADSPAKIELNHFDPGFDFATGEMAPDPLEKLCEKEGSMPIYLHDKNYPIHAPAEVRLHQQAG